jgi:predicted RNase H-like HicB family nuclease
MENNNKQIYNYTVLLEKEQDGGYHPFCPILRGCHSQGDTFEESIENITEAIEIYIESLVADNQPTLTKICLGFPLNSSLFPICNKFSPDTAKPLPKLSEFRG